MGKWLNKEKYKEFIKERKEENEQNQQKGSRFDMVWPTPKPGTAKLAKTYELRFLPDKNEDFYKRYFQHYIKGMLDQKSHYILCPKTFNMDAFCPICAINAKLWAQQNMTQEDKDLAYRLKRTAKFVSNVYIVDDPMDENREKDDKYTGLVKLYEFGKKVEAKISNQLMDKKHGIGISIFDPGEDGYDFLLKVGLTEPSGQNKQQFYDYDQSEFSRTSRAIGSDSEINKIMENVYDIDAYLDMRNKENTTDDIVKLLKDERLLGWVEEELKRFGWVKDSFKEANKLKVESTEESEQKPQSNENDIPDDGEEELSNEQLLAQLDEL